MKVDFLSWRKDECLHLNGLEKLLEKEEDGNLNDYERKVIWELSGLDNVKWWHRNIARKEFAINGVVTVYPDLMVMLENGKMLWC